MDILDEVMRLFSKAPRPTAYTLPTGASEEDIARFEHEQGITLPAELVEWLRRCNGPIIGPGVIFGISPAQENAKIETIYSLHPEWKRRGFIPVASDGCGDYYVLDAKNTVGTTHPVYFLEHEVNFEKGYVVASGLWTFLRFLLQREIHDDQAFQRGEEYDSYWPFDAQKVLAEDPALREYQGQMPLAWEA